jgi:hypothetical protein
VVTVNFGYGWVYGTGQSHVGKGGGIVFGVLEALAPVEQRRYEFLCIL